LAGMRGRAAVNRIGKTAVIGVELRLAAGGEIFGHAAGVGTAHVQEAVVDVAAVLRSLADLLTIALAAGRATNHEEQQKNTSHRLMLPWAAPEANKDRHAASPPNPRDAPR